MNKPGESQRRALGRGLTSLLPVKQAAAPQAAADDTGERVTELDIALIDPNPVQPRHVFQPDRLAELAQSIRANGIIQPLVVRRHGERYQLVAGERRWRAAKHAGLAKVPVVIQEIADSRLLELTLVENIQREDLNPMEAAAAFHRLANELHMSHEEIGERTGKDRTTITNLLRLLQLPTDVQLMVAERRLSQGHARCVLGLPAHLQREVAEKAVAQGWSVREMERITKRMLEPREARRVDDAQQLDPNVKAAIAELERVLGTRVRIVERAKQRGRIEIDYYSMEDLDRIYTVIAGG